MGSFEAPPSTLTEVPSCGDLVSWRSLVACFCGVLILFFLKSLKWVHKGNLKKDFAEQLSGMYVCSLCPAVSLQTHWWCVECVVLCLMWNKLFLTKGQISEWKSRREFWPWWGIHLRALSQFQKNPAQILKCFFIMSFLSNISKPCICTPGSGFGFTKLEGRSPHAAHGKLYFE